MGSTGKKSNEFTPRGEVDFDEIVHSSKDSIAFDKDFTIIPDGFMPDGGKKKDLKRLIDKYNITDVVVNMYRDKSGANDLQRMLNLGFEIEAYYKSEQGDSAIPPRDYYHLIKTKEAKEDWNNLKRKK